MATLGSVALVLLTAGVLCGTSGCSSIGYLAQQAGGQWQLLRSAKPVDDWLADPATPAEVRERLELAKRIRDYASRELKLPDNGSYRRYADLQRPAAVWNVVAAPELSLTLKTWCFPITGCIGYRGYFDRAAAEAEGAKLRAEGLEVSVYPVPAYSTLGWFDWAGGDPLLSTFIRWPEGELARLIFHELSHQVAYASGDTVFNESFATSVERIGGARWLATEAAPGAREDFERGDRRRQDFRRLTMATRDALEALYRSELDADAKRARKAELMAELRSQYAALKAGPWAGYSGYDAWFANANNASLGVMAAYLDLVPSFEQLFERQEGDFARFYAEVQRLAALPREARRAQLAGVVAP